jgi:hypothetical protein
VTSLSFSFSLSLSLSLSLLAVVCLFLLLYTHTLIPLHHYHSNHHYHNTLILFRRITTIRPSVRPLPPARRDHHPPSPRDSRSRLFFHDRRPKIHDRSASRCLCRKTQHNTNKRQQMQINFKSYADTALFYRYIDSRRRRRSSSRYVVVSPVLSLFPLVGLAFFLSYSLTHTHSFSNYSLCASFFIFVSPLRGY